jgi:hypothetical protein
MDRDRLPVVFELIVIAGMEILRNGSKDSAANGEFTVKPKAEGQGPERCPDISD